MKQRNLSSPGSVLVLLACAAGMAPGAHSAESEAPEPRTLTIDTARQVCAQKSWDLLTIPGQYHAVMPQVFSEKATIDGVAIVQSPEPGVHLQPGPFNVDIRTGKGEPVCRAAATVDIDPFTGAAPSIEFTPAHAGIQAQEPGLVIEPMTDPSGEPFRIQFRLNNEWLDQPNFAQVADALMAPGPGGTHLFDVLVTDGLQRNTLFQFSDYALTNKHKLGYKELLGSIKDWRDQNSGIGISERSGECRCALVTTPGDPVSCSSDWITEYETFGSRVWSSTCSGPETSWLRAFASDRGGAVEDVAESDQGRQSHDWTIVCKSPGQTNPERCESCCPNPVIWVEYDLYIPAMRAEVDTGWTLDGTARGELIVETSGLGRMTLHQSAVSGYEQVTTKLGLQVGGTAGKSKDGPALEVTGSVATEVEHSGSTGGAVTRAAQLATATGWKSGQCAVGETRLTSMTAKVLANGDPFIHESATVQGPRESGDRSYIRVRRAGFRCDGNTPASGTAQ